MSSHVRPLPRFSWGSFALRPLMCPPATIMGLEAIYFGMISPCKTWVTLPPSRVAYGTPTIECLVSDNQNAVRCGTR
ncbi:uncharacterized protein YALI1_C00107g [Yarrowia lipolytica]|uniref:Uncharacterized protein n=1 Tax=Yarrowia lipolytica TaxID=4952 RepID=A0A1D8N914_YARLL|nr:hypothetical protein YALI1_C00107g [Yarrowia lipolytica]